MYRQIAQVLRGNGVVSLTFSNGRDYDINKLVPEDTAPGLRTGKLLLLLILDIGLVIMVFCQEAKAKPTVARKQDDPQVGS